MNCKDCQATVTPSDRFCPACGTPNQHCKFHPKFGPEPKVFEPEILVERAADGAPACPRCARGITRGQDYCRGCGMEVGDALVGYSRRRVLEERRQSRRPAPAYQPLDHLNSGLRGMLTTLAVLGTIIGLGQLWRLARLENVLTAGPLEADFARILDIAGVLALSLSASAAVFTGMWAHRGLQNLPALAIDNDGWRSRVSPYLWLVPGVNLYRPKQIADILWRSGDRDMPPFSPDWRRAPTPALTAVTWAGIVVTATMAGLSQAVEAPAAGAAPAVTASLVVSCVFAAVAGITLAATAFMAQVLVDGISDRQAQRARAVLAIETAAPAEPTVVPTPAERGMSALRMQPSPYAPVWGRY